MYRLILLPLFFSLSFLQAHNFDVLIFRPAVPSQLDSDAEAAITNLAMVHTFNVVSTGSPTDINTSNLASYEVLLFLNRNGDDLDPTQRADVETFVQSGGGAVLINSALAEGTGWSWYDGLAGAYVDGAVNNQMGEIIVADGVHPSTANLPQLWNTSDAWYNLQANPRGDVHVLATLTENTISGGINGFDHPVSWCHEYDGGRIWVTTLGGTSGIYSDVNFIEHLTGGIEWSAGAQGGDAGVTIEDNFDIVILDDNNTDPMAMDIANDGRVFFIGKGGAISVWNPATGQTKAAGFQPVFPGGENGLMGMALAPDFPNTPHIYLHYTYQDGNWANMGPGEQRISRYEVIGDSMIMSSEEILLTYLIDRDAEIHSSGCLDFDVNGNLLIATGDNTSYGAGMSTNPYAPIDERMGNDIYDAQRTSGNTDDFRGKILRIKPSPILGNGYTLPSGNLFPPTDSTLGEIYIMGVRNPFRMTVDTATNWVYWGDVGPDAVTTDPMRGPIGKDEFNVAKSAGNFGWPYFAGANDAYNDYDFDTQTSGPAFDPSAPYNDSPHSTGKKNLPPAMPAFMWMDKQVVTPEFPEFDGGSATAMIGPVYHYDDNLVAVGKFPAYYDKTLFVMDWTRNWIMEVKLDANGETVKINPFLPSYDWRRPMDLKAGPDGNLYVLEWDLGWGGAANPDSRISQIRYTPEGRSPQAVADADVLAGPTPLTVNFDGSKSADPGGLNITHEWDFGDGSPLSTAISPTYTYTNSGTYTAKLTVTNVSGRKGAAILTVTVGNTQPVVDIIKPVDGGFFDFGDDIPFEVSVTDDEDGSTAAGTIQCGDLDNQTLLGHDDHAHPSVILNSCTGTFQTGTAGHAIDEDEITYLFEANYTDKGAPGTGTLTGSKIHLLHPKLKQAEHFTTSRGVSIAATGDSMSISDVVDIDGGDYIAFDPMNLKGIEEISFRVASGSNGGVIEIHKGLPNGVNSLVNTASVPNTGSFSTYTTITIPVTDPGGTDVYYFVFSNPVFPNNLFYLNWIHFQGDGVLSTTALDKDLEKALGLNLYPNPTTGELNIEMSAVKGELQLAIYNMNGSLLRTSLHEVPTAQTFRETLSLSGLPQGVYYLRVQNEARVVFRKVVKE